mmetsp:Transcript_32555/g.54515  ORF Transcript_32555/g.54515 Transcript_32555/m.54515 type:complete len:339 (+) Transcript_32555:1656-2672(+)
MQTSHALPLASWVQTIGRIDPISLQLTFALGLYFILSFSQPLSFAAVLDQHSCLLTHLDHSSLAKTLHSSGRVHSIAKKLESGLLTTKHTSSDGPTVETNTERNIRSIWTERNFEFFCKLFNLINAGHGKFHHSNSVISLGVRKTGYSQVAISNRFYLKDPMPFCNFIKCAIYCLKKNKDLAWLAGTTPGSETRNISKHDSTVWEQISDRRRTRSDSFCLIHTQRWIVHEFLHIGMVLVFEKTITNHVWKEGADNCICLVGSICQVPLTTFNQVIIEEQEQASKNENCSHSASVDGRGVVVECNLHLIRWIDIDLPSTIIIIQRDTSKSASFDLHFLS